MDAREHDRRRSQAVALMRLALDLLDDEQDGYILMRLQHAIDEAEGSAHDRPASE